MPNILFLPAARIELMEARDWYERRSPALGDASVSEADRQIQRIARTPLEFPPIVEDVRRARLRRFPYSLFFRLVDNDCFVIACFHASRDPTIWRGRTKP